MKQQIQGPIRRTEQQKPTQDKDGVWPPSAREFMKLPVSGCLDRETHQFRFTRPTPPGSSGLRRGKGLRGAPCSSKTVSPHMTNARPPEAALRHLPWTQWSRGGADHLLWHSRSDLRLGYREMTCGEEQAAAALISKGRSRAVDRPADHHARGLQSRSSFINIFGHPIRTCLPDTLPLFPFFSLHARPSFNVTRPRSQR